VISVDFAVGLPVVARRDPVRDPVQPKVLNQLIRNRLFGVFAGDATGSLRSRELGCISQMSLLSKSTQLSHCFDAMGSSVVFSLYAVKTA
jgi:hypothetical protein